MSDSADPSSSRAAVGGSTMADALGTASFRLSPEVNSARDAAMQVALWPPVADPRTRQEIRLHIAFYRAAMQSSDPAAPRRFLLRPAAGSAGPPLPIDPRCFALRVLAGLDDPGATVAWATPSTPETVGRKVFPGTRDPAIELRISIVDRNNASAAVAAEISSVAPHATSVRENVYATWDGVGWAIRRDRIRIEW